MIGVDDGVNKIAGMYILITKEGPYFFADTTVNLNPSVDEIVDITLLVNKMIKRFKIVSDRYRNRRKRFGLRFNLIAAIYNMELAE